MNVLIIIFAFMSAVGEAFEKNYVEPFMTMSAEEAFQCSESIARGEGCTECGSHWMHHSPTRSTLIHREACKYLAFVKGTD